MMHIPSNFKKLLPQAKRFSALDIEFSSGTYQVEIADPDTKHNQWAFIQLDQRGRLKDCFCSCENGDSESPCIHIVASFLRIYQDPAAPLHQRFEKSLWNALGKLFSKIGDDVHVLKNVGAGHFVHQSSSGKIIFDIEGLTKDAKKKIDEIIYHRKRETEETSLKFSNLSAEEIMHWREGRPSESLRYELSFWNDFAKWFMLMQDNGERYRISYEYDNDKLPNFLNIDFDEVGIGFYISKANLPLIIPSLATVKSPLKVYGGTEKAFRKIEYDRNEGILIIDPLPQKAVSEIVEKKGILIPGWRFVEGAGFYPSDQKRLIEERSLQGIEISEFLNEHLALLKNNLQGAVIHDDVVPVSYALSFDSSWNFHITTYLFNPGDLTYGNSRCFGDWIYLNDDGFYKISENRFPEIDTVISSEHVGAFVSQYRTWLNTQEGFQTHVVGIESQLSYSISASNQLTFFRDMRENSLEEGSKDFSPWIYSPGQGFYSKTSSHIGLPIKPGISLHADQIPLFIRTNHEELKLVPNFFSGKQPIENSSLHVQVEEGNKIIVKPVDKILPDYLDRKIQLFEEFVYIEGEGFSELPSASRLPHKYRQPVAIEYKDIEAFIRFEMEAIKPYLSYVDPRLMPPSTARMELSNIEKIEHSYKLKINYVTNIGTVSVPECWKGFKTRNRFILTNAGLLDLHERKFNWIHWLRKEQIDLRSHTIQLTNWELLRLNAFEEILPVGPKKAQIQKQLDELFDLATTSKPDLTGLQSQLRPYQEIGVNWLWFLYQQGLSGLLCDDMGLGKTHQTMALISAIVNGNRSKKMKFVILCPTSVLYHWQEKLAEFLPDLKVFTYYGLKRTLEGFQQNYDILLSSYGIWRQDVEVLSELTFEAAIFDEIQIAKNHSSRIYATLQSMKTRMRLGLTGTPIENYLRELKSLFDLILPGYMPGETDFKELFVKPIEREGDNQQKRLLNRLIKPFVLRRKKEDVLLDLPEKIEEVSHCDLTENQRLLYDEVLSRSRERILKELEDESNPIPYMHIFALLSSLKQICDHPAVYLKTPQKYQEYTSGKWDLFVELLEEARESRQKVVVFSQYLYMLDIIEAHLNEQGIGYASIRGATQNRGEQLQRFNKDPNCEVFVASLQASGLGVDLTAASVVIHYDRWWNAARENQATDRVHRIGQIRGVQVIKFVTKFTFEERIDELISRKGRLMEEVVSADDHEVFKQFSRDEIIQLLTIVR